MKDISEYNAGMSEYELFSFIYDKVMAKEITSFSQFREFAEQVFRDKERAPVIMRIFELIKRINWGFFSAISFNTHRRLWRELVIPDKDFPEAGDLKKTLQISDLYIAMLDIHGYTQFCMDSRKNLSMMHTLDRAMENEVRRISTQCGAISQRERGDEMVVVAASATDALMVTLCIIDYFGKTEIVHNPAISTKRTGNAEALPIFKITAGITGGNTQSPLIITERGNLAGFLLNSGARLQTRANELSPKESKIMIAKQVMMNYTKENAQTKCCLVKNNSIYFFDTGHIEFKGVMIPTCEVVFDGRERRYKEKISEEMIKLYNSIRENHWEQRIFQNLIEILYKLGHTLPEFSITPREPIHGMQTVNNESYMNLCRRALKAYNVDEDYYSAVEFLHHIISISEQIPLFDRLILDYMRGISERYTLLLDDFGAYVDREVDEKAELIFQANYYKAWLAAKNGAQMYEKLKTAGRKSPEVSKKKTIWLGLIAQNKEKMEFTLYSGKK
ncbi:MAG: hypothetical protein LBU82_05365 [Treponema sp.]|jgi:hypothetical protein|nr:hypothetical protein [Treponema sp.]